MGKGDGRVSQAEGTVCAQAFSQEGVWWWASPVRWWLEAGEGSQGHTIPSPRHLGWVLPRTLGGLGRIALWWWWWWWRMCILQ